jgi:hypothetical protein
MRYCDSCVWAGRDGSPGIQIQRSPAPGRHHSERDVERRQDLRAVQGDVPLGVGGGPKHLEIDGRTHDLRLRRRAGGSGESQQGQADRGLSGIHVLLRRVGGGRSLCSHCVARASAFIAVRRSRVKRPRTPRAKRSQG